MELTRSLLLRASRSPWLEQQLRSRKFAQRAVRRFMPGENSQAALGAALDLARQGIGTVLTALGERVHDPVQAQAVCRHYVDVLGQIRQRALPAQISVKLTHLGLDASPEECIRELRTLGDEAGTDRSTLWIDMEESAYTDATLGLYRVLRSEGHRVGICLQTYLRRTAEDLENLLPLAPAIRLVKGAYDEPVSIAFRHRRETDAQFLALASTLLERAAAGEATPVFGTHDLTLIQRIRDVAERLSVPKQSYEFHMLYGIRETDQRQLAAEGCTVRVLISYGEAWFPWYMRRLAERPANLWFALRHLV